MVNKVAPPHCPTVPTPYTGTAGQLDPATKLRRDSGWDTGGTVARKAAVDRHFERDAWGDRVWDTSFSLRYFIVLLSHSLEVGQWDSWKGPQISLLDCRAVPVCPLFQGASFPLPPFPPRPLRRCAKTALPEDKGFTGNLRDQLGNPVSNLPPNYAQLSSVRCSAAGGRTNGHSTTIGGSTLLSEVTWCPDPNSNSKEASEFTGHNDRHIDDKIDTLSFLMRKTGLHQNPLRLERIVACRPLEANVGAQAIPLHRARNAT